MDRQTYGDEILLAYLGDIRASATFSQLQDNLALSGDQALKLDLLRRIELHVAAALEPVLQRHGIAPGDLAGTQAAGRALAAGIPDWQALVARLGARLLPYIDRYDALRDHALPADADALQLLSDHEHALYAFGRLEAAGRTDGSAAVLAEVISDQGLTPGLPS